MKKIAANRNYRLMKKSERNEDGRLLDAEGLWEYTPTDADVDELTVKVDNHIKEWEAFREAIVAAWPELAWSREPAWTEHSGVTPGLD